jgi:hypothetical protein
MHYWCTYSYWEIKPDAQKGRTGKQEAELLFAVWQEKTNTKTGIIQKHVIRLLFSTDT